LHHRFLSYIHPLVNPVNQIEAKPESPSHAS
jgi:hypothetical protein